MPFRTAGGGAVETVTVVRRGVLDHSDSLGAAARYGEGDVQWLTAGGRIDHAEMFPLRRTGFGGWPWGDEEPVHGRDKSRFARHADGRVERSG